MELDLFKLMEMDKMIEEIIEKFDTTERMMMIGVIADSVIAEKGYSVREFYDKMAEVGAQVEEEEGRFVLR